MRTIQGVFFFNEGFFFSFIAQPSFTRKNTSSCYSSTASENIKPLKKAVATDKENTSMVRGPHASEDTASSNENKACCKFRPFADRPSQKPAARKYERD